MSLFQDHFLQYADLPQRRAVPLALALHSPSRAKPGIIDTLSKLSHDVDAEVALNAIFAMGIVGAGERAETPQRTVSGGLAHFHQGRPGRYFG